jgi:tight adherence protein C
MFYLAVGCSMVAVITVFISISMFGRRLYERSKPYVSDLLRRDSDLSSVPAQSIHAQQSYHYLWWLTGLLGRPLIPFVTWGQRRRLSLHIQRAGLTRCEFMHIYCLQCVSALLTVMICVWWLHNALLELHIIAYLCLIACASCGWWCPIFWLKRMHQLRLRRMSDQLPFFLDMVSLGLDAGLNLQAAIQLALEHIGEGALHQEWSIMLADMRAGQSRMQSLRNLSQRLNLSSMRQLISSLIQGESMGFSMGRIIQVYADQQRAQRLMQAEKQALQAPVKMLFPMALCIFPCTFIILGFPVVVQLLGLS